MNLRLITKRLYDPEHLPITLPKGPNSTLIKELSNDQNNTFLCQSLL